jgi:hypothetical protein
MEENITYCTEKKRSKEEIPLARKYIRFEFKRLLLSNEKHTPCTLSSKDSSVLIDNIRAKGNISDNENKKVMSLHSLQYNRKVDNHDLKGKGKKDEEDEEWKQSSSTHTKKRKVPSSKIYLTCEICKKTFKSELGYKYHIEKVCTSVANKKRKEENFEFECDICKKKLKSVYGINYHKTNVCRGQAEVEVAVEKEKVHEECKETMKVGDEEECLVDTSCGVIDDLVEDKEAEMDDIQYRTNEMITNAEQSKRRIFCDRLLIGASIFVIDTAATVLEVDRDNLTVKVHWKGWPKNAVEFVDVEIEKIRILDEMKRTRR